MAAAAVAAENSNQQGFVSHPLIQIEPLSIHSSLEFYHVVVLHFYLFLTLLKLLMLNSAVLFIKITNEGITLDNMELFPNSPWILALFTISFLSFSSYVGRTTIDRTQYAFLKVVPFAIVLIHSSILLFKRKFVVTIDDIFCLIIFLSSISLYFTYESPYAVASGRFP